MSEAVVETMMTLANVFILQDRYPEAEKMLRQAEPIARKVFGQNDPIVAAIRHNIGGVLQEQDRIEEAVEFFCTSLDMFVEWYGSESVEVASNLVCMGKIFVLRGEYLYAREPFQKALELYQTEEDTFRAKGIGSNALQTA
jgi:tetratricopeptide (TPR) repeat protein